MTAKTTGLAAGAIGDSLEGSDVAEMAKFRFIRHFHPYVCALTSEARRDGADGIFAPDDTLTNSFSRQQIRNDGAFEATHLPSLHVELPYPVDEIGFDPLDSYAHYNWELHFHAPLLVANRLATEQRFDEAIRWYRAIFDPTNHNAAYDPSVRPWKVKGLMVTDADPAADWAAFTGANGDMQAQAAFEAQVAAWRESPFDPHAIAALRPGAYQRAVFMKTLDALIGYGDQLFSMDTIESINEATQLYVLAADLLGPKPELLPQVVESAPQSYNDLRDSLDDFSNAIVEIENLLFSPNVVVAPTGPTWTGLSWYFCVPPNDTLLRYWDIVADRLFKIRNCRNIAGTVRVLPLFEPPIDPALLVRATALGVDLGSAIDAATAPLLPAYRFNALLDRANRFCGTVKGLGSALLAALNGMDGEALGLIRAKNEVTAIDRTLGVLKLRIDEAQRQIDISTQTRAAAQARLDYYTGLRAAGLIDVELRHLDTLDQAEIETKRGNAAAATVAIAGPAAAVVAAGVSSITLSPSNALTALATTADVAATYFHGRAQTLNNKASKQGIRSGHRRRESDWDFQIGQAGIEIENADRQILAAQIRLDIATREQANTLTQLEESRQVEEFLRSKFTNADLHGWMVGQLSTTYFRSYQLAVDLARRAEICYRHEIGDDAIFIRPGQWDSLRKGLLSGEQLQADLDLMEASYLQNDIREHEVTKHISLARLDPVALERIRFGDDANFDVPNALFDLDFPQHYFRRLKGVSVTVSGITGPFTNVHARLELLTSKTQRTEASATLEPRGENSESVVTSGAQQDSGVFRFDFMDPRYMPFERRGAVTSWNLSFPGGRNFDWQSISDITLTLQYTAREAVGTRATVPVEADLPFATTHPAVAFSMKRDFPSEWHRFQNPDGELGPNVLTVPLSRDLLPYRDALEPTFEGLLRFYVVPSGASLSAAPTFTNPGPNSWLSTAAPSFAASTEEPFATAGFFEGEVEVPAGSVPASISLERTGGAAAAEMGDIIVLLAYQA